MKLIRIGDRFFNMDLLVEARIETEAAVLYFAAACPYSIYAQDEASRTAAHVGTVRPYEVRLIHDDARTAGKWLADRDESKPPDTYERRGGY